MRHSMARRQGGQAVNIVPEDSELDNYSRSFDELEDELNKANERIKRLKQAGDVMYTLLDPPSISMRTTEYDNALQGWDDAKIK